MTAPHQSRAVLSEIAELLNVATTPTTELADEPIAANIHNQTFPGRSFPLTYLSPIPSPDEIVIRQRGRRRISLSWSPEKCPTSSRYPFQKTPTKNTSTMTLRSSPRKRLMVSDNNPRTPEKCNVYSPKKTDGGYGRSNATPVMKRLKLEDKPLAQSATGTPLHVILKGLSHEQLIGVIKNVVRSEPHLEEKIRADIPKPDLRPMEDQLLHVKRNIFRSLPTCRLVKKTDSAAYSRAATHLTAFKKLIVAQSRVLYDSRHWDALIDYIIMAWSLVRATPIWDNNSHNAVRRQCFKILSCHCSAAIKMGGSLFALQRLNELETQLKSMSKDCEDIVECSSQLSTLLQKMRN